MQIPFRYLGHPTKPKTTFYLNLRTLCETKNESQFRSPGTMQSEKRISILTSEYSGSEKWIAILLSECPGSQKWISICVSGHSVKRKMNYDFAFGVSGKPKMNCDFAFWVLRKAKMNLDFASRSVRKPKMNCDFASLSVRSRQNELRFCFPECLWSKIEIHFELHFVRWVGDNNLLNLRRRVRLYTPHFVSLIDEWRWMTRGFKAMIAIKLDG